jgi:hypothetical protein
MDKSSNRSTQRRGSLAGFGTLLAVWACGHTASNPGSSASSGASAGGASSSVSPSVGGSVSASTAGSSETSPTGGEPTEGGASGSQAGLAASAGVGGHTGAVAIYGANNYEITGTWPQAPVVVRPKPGQLKYTKQVIQSDFLAASCAIGDYNNDGQPDVSSGRIWYQGPDFKLQHPFRDGHGALPRDGAAEEIFTGLPDDWADYPFDVNSDGNTDIINCSQIDANAQMYTPTRSARCSRWPRVTGTKIRGRQTKAAIRNGRGTCCTATFAAKSTASST